MKEKIRNLLHDLLTDISKQEYPNESFIDKWETEILSLFPSLDNLEVVKDCKECLDNGRYKFCPHCQGTGKVTRAASWEDIDLVWLIRVATGICIVNEYRVPSGGILRVKGEE